MVASTARMAITTMSSARVNQESFAEAALRSVRETREEMESETRRGVSRFDIRLCKIIIFHHKSTSHAIIGQHSFKAGNPVVLQYNNRRTFISKT